MPYRSMKLCLMSLFVMVMQVLFWQHKAIILAMWPLIIINYQNVLFNDSICTIIEKIPYTSTRGQSVKLFPLSSNFADPLNHFATETRIFWDNYDTPMAVDALAHGTTKSSVAMLLTVQNLKVIHFHREGF